MTASSQDQHLVAGQGAIAAFKVPSIMGFVASVDPEEAKTFTHPIHDSGYFLHRHQHIHPVGDVEISLCGPRSRVTMPS